MTTINPFHAAHETSLSTLSATDWNAMRSHWMMFSGMSFCRRIGRKWTVEGFGFRNAPLFTTKAKAEEYASNLIRAEAKHRRKLEWEQENRQH